MMGTWVPYIDEEHPLEGYLAAPNAARDLPGVLVVPSWLNINESICRRANRLSELGYATFVADLFGAGVRPLSELQYISLISTERSATLN